MASTMRMPPARAAAGMTLLEAVFALLLLSVCLIPAANALRGAINVPADSALAARELDCVSTLMESVLAEPYGNLYAAVGEPDAPSTYSTPAGANALPTAPDCPPMTVTITSYGTDRTRKLDATGTSSYLLRVVAFVTADGRFPLATLVAQ